VSGSVWKWRPREANDVLDDEWMPPRGCGACAARVLGLRPVRAGAPKRRQSRRGGTTAAGGDVRRDELVARHAARARWRL